MPVRCAAKSEADTWAAQPSGEKEPRRVSGPGSAPLDRERVGALLGAASPRARFFSSPIWKMNAALTGTRCSPVRQRRHGRWCSASFQREAAEQPRGAGDVAGAAAGPQRPAHRKCGQSRPCDRQK